MESWLPIILGTLGGFAMLLGYGSAFYIELKPESIKVKKLALPALGSIVIGTIALIFALFGF